MKNWVAAPNAEGGYTILSPTGESDSGDGHAMLATLVSAGEWDEEAVARLASAAPQLLEALRVALPYVCSIDSTSDGRVQPVREDEKRIRAAIAKAVQP